MLKKYKHKTEKEMISYLKFKKILEKERLNDNVTYYEFPKKLAKLFEIDIPLTKKECIEEMN